MMENTKDTKCLNILEQTMFWIFLTKDYRRTMTKDSMTLKAFEYIYVCDKLSYVNKLKLAKTCYGHMT
jgi:hypothetical protein